MDILAFFAAVLGILGDFPGGRVTVKDRYEMKKRFRDANGKNCRSLNSRQPAISFILRPPCEQ
jgi:hypothetical protein